MPVRSRPDSWLSLAVAAWLTLGAAGAFASEQEPVATVGKQTVPASELDARTANKLSALQKSFEQSQRQTRLSYERERHQLAEEELNALLDEKVLGLEAAARKSTADALRAGVAVPAVTDDQIKNFFESNQGQIQQSYDKVAPLIKDYLQKQARESAMRSYLDGLRAKYQVSMVLEPLREPIVAAGPQRGPLDAAVTIVEFSDFQCPFCGRFSPVVKQVLSKYPTQVRLVYRHMPLTSLHPNAQRAAEAAVCAQEQGKFWEMHDLMFAEQSALAEDALKDKATRIGLDGKTFDECLASGRARTAVQQDVDAGEQLGISGTPFSFVNGRALNGAASAAELNRLIEDELRRIQRGKALPAARR